MRKQLGITKYVPVAEAAEHGGEEHDSGDAWSEFKTHSATP